VARGLLPYSALRYRRACSCSESASHALSSAAADPHSRTKAPRWRGHTARRNVVLRCFCGEGVPSDASTPLAAKKAGHPRHARFRFAHSGGGLLRPWDENRRFGTAETQCSRRTNLFPTSMSEVWEISRMRLHLCNLAGLRRAQSGRQLPVCFSHLARPVKSEKASISQPARPRQAARFRLLRLPSTRSARSRHRSCACRRTASRFRRRRRSVLPCAGRPSSFRGWHRRFPCLPR